MGTCSITSYYEQVIYFIWWAHMKNCVSQMQLKSKVTEFGEKKFNGLGRLKLGQEQTSGNAKSM